MKTRKITDLPAFQAWLQERLGPLFYVSLVDGVVEVRDMVGCNETQWKEREHVIRKFVNTYTAEWIPLDE